jgi:hypothetical protein
MIKFQDILLMKNGKANLHGHEIPLGQIVGNPYATAFASVQEDITEDEMSAESDLDEDIIEEYCPVCLAEVLLGKHPEQLGEAEYKGRKIKLGKIMRGDVKKFKVFVKDPSTGNIKKVNFGDPNMRIKKNIPARRKSFRARHNCDNPGPRTKARYWACRTW